MLFLRLRFDDQLSVHHHPMSWKGAKIGVSSRLVRDPEVDSSLPFRFYNIRVADYVLTIRNVMSKEGIGVIYQSVGKVPNFLEAPRLDERPIVRHNVRISKRQLQDLASRRLEGT